MKENTNRSDVSHVEVSDNLVFFNMITRNNTGRILLLQNNGFNIMNITSAYKFRWYKLENNNSYIKGENIITYRNSQNEGYSLNYADTSCDYIQIK